jgi:ABC-type phosphate/phosphonate transport system substrate-binding protein
MKSPPKAIFIQRKKEPWLTALPLGLLLALAVFHPALAAELRPIDLRVGFTKSCFLGVNRNDAEASFKAFLATVGRQREYDVHSAVRIFEDTPSFEAAINRREIHLAIVDSWQYVSMDIQKAMDPYFVPVAKDNVGRNYMVLTRQGSGLNTMEDLRGKEIAQLEMGSATMGQPWLETLLMMNGLGVLERFFGKIDVVGKPSSAVLPVFFGKKHACLVDKVGLDIMTELNPQLGSKLQAIATSEPYADNVLCLSKDGWTSETYKQDTIRALAELHLEPAGQQILTLFKVAKLAPFQDQHLNTVKKLRMMYEKLRKENNR